ncbi:hypoxia-inducible factor 1-alpha inhibitor-like [Asterias amurensis]|uniref:hypoxia-inducible factor 1-alpha inhibitor-like n=1 Tax=Asterias amurensis TaxID=7602 RepID=UPI003AB849A7
MPLEFVNKPVPITRVEHLRPDSFKQRYRNKHPIILTKIISDWLPVTKWTTSYLQEALEQTCPNGDLQVFSSLDNKLFINNPEVVQTVNISPKDFLNLVFDHQEQSAKQRFYLRTHSMPDILFNDINIPAQVKSLLDVFCSNEDENTGMNRAVEVQCPTKTENVKERTEQSALCSPDEGLSAWEQMLSCDVHDENSVSIELEDSANIQQKLPHYQNVSLMDTSWQKLQARIFNQPTMQLWVGTKGNVTPLHYDRNHGLLAQIVGRKELILFSHEDTPNLYPHVSYSERAHTSRVDLRKVYAEEDKRFPRLKNAQPYTCTLQPGELLYMPPFWWHDVTSLDDCVSVTLPWDMDSSETVPGCMLA